MPNPLDALRNAQTIGGVDTNTYAYRRQHPESNFDSPESMMGLLGGASSEMALPASLANLKGLAGRGAAAIQKYVPSAIQSLFRATPAAAPSTLGMGMPAAETLGEQMAEFAPVGAAGEVMYNAGRQGIQKVTDPLEAAFQRLRQTGGR